MKAKRVYAKGRDTKGQPVRLCGILEPDSDIVVVHIVNGPRLGGFRLERFGGKLTPKTLYTLFNWESTMKHYHDMSTPDLVEWALRGPVIQSPTTDRLVYALAKRLEKEYQRAELHMNKALDCQRLHIKQKQRRASYIKVAKPHIQLVSSSGFGWPTRAGEKPIWRCTGSFGTVQFGTGPREAYAAWRRVMEQGHGIPRK